MNTYTLILNKMFTNRIEEYMEGIIHYDKWGLFHECKASLMLENKSVTHNINLKKKNYKCIPIIAEKAFDNIHHPFIIRKKKSANQGKKGTISDP